MKYLVIFLVLVGCTAFVPHTFGAQQNLFEGNSSFERLPDTITPNTIYEFELKFQITDSPYWLHGISPVVDINPKTDASNVHISFEKIPSGFFAIYRVPVTLYVDQNISSEKIFLNVSFVSENSSGDELRSSWSESLVLNIDTANTNDKNYRFIDFSYAHMVGEPIKFTLEKMADDNCNSYDAEIIDEEGNFVLGWGAEISCDPDWASNSAPVQTKIGYKESHPIIINDSGKYYLKIEFDDVNINQEFVVRQNHSGASLDRTVYPVPWERSPLKQFNSGISFDEIHCKTGLVLIQKYDGSPACVTESTKQKLIERGWTDSTMSTKSSECNTDMKEYPLSKPLSDVYANRLVLFMQPESTASFCVYYKSNLDNTGTSDITPTLYTGEILLEKYEGPKVSVDVEPKNVSLEHGTETFAKFTVTTTQNSTGVYHIIIPQLSRLPIVVWEDRQSVGANEIPVYSGFRSSGNIVLDAALLWHEEDDFLNYSVAEIRR